MSVLNYLKNLRQSIANLIAPEKEERRLDPWEVFGRLLNEHYVVTALIDSSFDGVVLPKHLTNVGDIQLQYGRNLVNPIPDLHVGTDGINATLSFNRKPFRTFVPWGAVKAFKGGNPGPVGPGGGSPNLLVIKGGRHKDEVENDDKVYAEAA